jgi:hypothetical protein
MDNEISIKILAKIQDLEKNMKSASKIIDNFSKTSTQKNEVTAGSFSKLGTTIQTALGFSLASAIQSSLRVLTQFYAVNIKEASNMQKQMQSLNIMYRDNADVLLDELNVALVGTVNRMELLKNANKAIMLQLDPKQLPQLFAVAGARAKAMGISTTQAIEDITTGIGRRREEY